MLLLIFLFSFPQIYLAILLAFDLKYFDASEKAFTVPIYPWPTYMKVVLSVVSIILTNTTLCYLLWKQEKDKNQQQDIASDETISTEA